MGFMLDIALLPFLRLPQRLSLLESFSRIITALEKL